MGDDRSGDGSSLAADLRAAGIAGGLARVGFASVEPLVEARVAIEQRLADGHDAGMQFTFRNPGRSTDPRTALPSARAAVVGLATYPAALDDDPDPAEPMGRVAWYATEDHYARLDAGLQAIADVLRRRDHRAVVVADANALVDRAIAERAGLGWFGKNANLLAPGLGSWFVIGSVLTDAPLAAHDAPLGDGCGTCRRCLPACPTGAIVAPGVIDARRCLAWLVQRDGDIEPWARMAMGDRIYGCDDCQEACPPDRQLAREQRVGEISGRFVPLVDLLASDDETLLARHGRWYLPRRDPAVLRRNALVALGNTGDPDDPRVVAAVADHLGHRSAMVRRHAVWAARRLGLVALLDAVVDDPDPGVRAETVAEVPA